MKDSVDFTEVVGDYVPWPEKGVGIWVIELKAGEQMINPNSTKHNLYGPLRLEFERYVDGGIRVRFLDEEE